jgi:hypothetical protein
MKASIDIFSDLSGVYPLRLKNGGLGRLKNGLLLFQKLKK